MDVAFDVYLCLSASSADAITAVFRALSFVSAQEK